MPIYEVKYFEKDEWIEISDLELVDQLYRNYRRVTPAIKQMMMGKKIETPNGIYRLKLKDGVQGEKQSELSAPKHNEYDQITPNDITRLLIS